MHQYLNMVGFKHSPFLINKIICSIIKVYSKFIEYLIDWELKPSVNDLTVIQRSICSSNQGCNLQTLEYWSQIFKNNRFAKFDYYENENLKRYG